MPFATLADVLAFPILSPADYAALRDPLVAEAMVRGLELKLAPEASGVTNTMTLIAMATAGKGGGDSAFENDPT